jgi:hypothetical protein
MNAPNLAEKLTRRASFMVVGAPGVGRQTCPEYGPGNKIERRRGNTAQRLEINFRRRRKNVQKIKFQPIGGLKFIWQLERDLKSAHRDDKFVSQLVSIAPTSILGRNFVILPVTLSVKVPSVHHPMTGTKFAFGMVRPQPS